MILGAELSHQILSNAQQQTPVSAGILQDGDGAAIADDAEL